MRHAVLVLLVLSGGCDALARLLDSEGPAPTVQPGPAPVGPVVAPAAPVVPGVSPVAPATPPGVLPTPPAQPVDLPRAPALAFGPAIRGQAPPTGETAPYLVIGFATWCPGCVAEIPTVSALAARMRGRAHVVAITDETPDQASGYFRARQQNPLFRFDYPLVQDTQGIGRQLGIRGIPIGFVLHGGHVVWSGSPIEAGPILEACLAGRFDAAALSRDEQALQARARQVFDHLDAGRNAEAQAAGAAFVTAAGERANQLNGYAWELLTRQGRRDAALALPAAENAVRATGSQDFNILDTLALALYETGNRPRAVELQTTAVAMCRLYTIDGHCGEFEERLTRFRSGS